MKKRKVADVILERLEDFSKELSYSYTPGNAFFIYKGSKYNIIIREQEVELITITAPSDKIIFRDCIDVNWVKEEIIKLQNKYGQGVDIGINCDYKGQLMLWVIRKFSEEEKEERRQRFIKDMIKNHEDDIVHCKKRIEEYNKYED
jgi:hypothetical protein